MNILFLSTEFPTPHRPTKGLFNYYLVRALSQDHRVRVVAPIPWLDREERGPAKGGGAENPCSRTLDGIEVHHPRYYYPPKVLRHRYAWFYWRSARGALWNLMEAAIPDLILSYWSHPDGAVATHLGRVLGVPSAVIVGGSDVLLLARDARRRAAIVTALRTADVVFAVSRNLRMRLVELGVPAEKVLVWERGVDRERFSPGDRREARRRLGLPAEGRVLLWVGRMVPVKGLDVLLEACGRLRDGGVDYRLYLVGDGPLRQALEAESSARGLSQAVAFAGSRQHTELPDWYRAADLTVLPSRSEGLPNVLRESLACGTPFVASQVGGIPELADGTSSRLVPPGDAPALAAALARALAENGTAAQPQAAGRGWRESVEHLLGPLRPLVERSQDLVWPWWVRHPADRAAHHDGVPAVRSRVARLLRHAVAGIVPRGFILRHGPRASRSVCLTFDDGPHPEHTPRLLDALKRAGVRATFFVVGRLVERYPDVVRRMAAEGHLIENHSFYHTKLTYLTAAEMIAGLRRTRDLLFRLTGHVSMLYRPPYGALTSWQALRVWGVGQSIALWNRDPRDYQARSPADVREWFRQNPLRGGDVVLMHDRLPGLDEVVVPLIEDARKAGLGFTTLKEWGRGPSGGSVAAEARVDAEKSAP